MGKVTNIVRTELLPAVRGRWGWSEEHSCGLLRLCHLIRTSKRCTQEKWRKLLIHFYWSAFLSLAVPELCWWENLRHVFTIQKIFLKATRDLIHFFHHQLLSFLYAVLETATWAFHMAGINGAGPKLLSGTALTGSTLEGIISEITWHDKLHSQTSQKIKEKMPSQSRGTKKKSNTVNCHHVVYNCHTLDTELNT